MAQNPNFTHPHESKISLGSPSLLVNEVQALLPHLLSGFNLRQHTRSQQIKVRASVHGTLHQFQAVHLPFRLPVAPRSAIGAGYQNSSYPGRQTEGR